MKLVIELPDNKVISIRKCAERGIELDSTYMAVVNGVPYEERKTGKWIRVDSNTFKCSKCGNFLNFRGVNAGRGDANYCPNCGAKMEVDE